MYVCGDCVRKLVTKCQSQDVSPSVCCCPLSLPLFAVVGCFFCCLLLFCSVCNWHQDEGRRVPRNSSIVNRSIKDENLTSLNPDFLIICHYIAVSGQIIKHNKFHILLKFLRILCINVVMRMQGGGSMLGLIRKFRGQRRSGAIN